MLNSKPYDLIPAPFTFDSGMYLNIRSVLNGTPKENCKFGSIALSRVSKSSYPDGTAKFVDNEYSSF